MITNWKITIETNRFQSVMLVKGTEKEMKDYLESELSPYATYSYVGLDDYLADMLAESCLYRYLAPEVQS